MLHPLIENAYKVLYDGTLTRAEALELAERIEGEDILDIGCGAGNQARMSEK